MLKSLIWIAIGAATLIFGLRFQKDRQIRELEAEQASLQTRASDLVREISLAKAKEGQARIDSTAGADYESKHNASVINTAAEQKKIDQILGKWPEVEAGRSAAVQKVREKEATRPPYALTLTDGTKLQNFVLRSVPEENLVSVEHSSGLVKLTSDKLPEDLRKRLGLGWKPVLPQNMSLDKDGNGVLKEAMAGANMKSAADAVAMELALEKFDTTTMAGVSNAISIVESKLVKAQAAFEAEKAALRKYQIFKPETIASGSDKTYATLKKEASTRMAGHSGRVNALRAQKVDLQKKLKAL